MKIRNRRESEKSGLNMTSMIDIVFLLLVFFVMTFKIVELEGDFSVRMPLAGSSSVQMDPTDLPLKLRLRADADGMLTSMVLNEIDLNTDFDQLRSNVVSLIGSTESLSACSASFVATSSITGADRAAVKVCGAGIPTARTGSASADPKERTPQAATTVARKIERRTIVGRCISAPLSRTADMPRRSRQLCGDGPRH